MVHLLWLALNAEAGTACVPGVVTDASTDLRVCGLEDRQVTLLDPVGARVPLERVNGCIEAMRPLMQGATYHLELSRTPFCDRAIVEVNTFLEADADATDIVIGSPSSEAPDPPPAAMRGSTVTLPVAAGPGPVEIEASLLGWTGVAHAVSDSGHVRLGLAADDTCRPAQVRARPVDAEGRPSGPWTMARPVPLTDAGACPPPEPLREPEWIRPEPMEHQGPAVATVGGLTAALGLLTFAVVPLLGRRRRW